jgi:hypothetical protein
MSSFETSKLLAALLFNITDLCCITGGSSGTTSASESSVLGGFSIMSYPSFQGLYPAYHSHLYSCKSTINARKRRWESLSKTTITSSGSSTNTVTFGAVEEYLLTFLRPQLTSATCYSNLPHFCSVFVSDLDKNATGTSFCYTYVTATKPRSWLVEG